MLEADDSLSAFFCAEAVLVNVAGRFSGGSQVDRTGISDEDNFVGAAQTIKFSFLNDISNKITDP